MTYNLTLQQRCLLLREQDPSYELQTFILLNSIGEDRIAKNLAAKGLGRFADFSFMYSWRKRDGFFNHFEPNEAGLAEIKRLKRETK